MSRNPRAGFIWTCDGHDVTFEEPANANRPWRSELRYPGTAFLAWQRGKTWRGAVIVGSVARLSTRHGSPQRCLDECARWFARGC